MSTSTSSNSVYHYIELYHADCDACYKACYDAYYETIRRIVDVFTDNYLRSRTPLSPDDDIEFDLEAAAVRADPTLLPECWVSFYICPWRLDAELGFNVPHEYVDDALRMVRGESLAGPLLDSDDTASSTSSDDAGSSTTDTSSDAESSTTDTSSDAESSTTDTSSDDAGSSTTDTSSDDVGSSTTDTSFDDAKPSELSTPTSSDDARSSFVLTKSECEPTTMVIRKAPVQTRKRKRALDDEGDETDAEFSGRMRSGSRRVAPDGTRLLSCPFNGCSQVFKTKGDLNRHVTSAAKHNPEKAHRCPNPHCKKTISRLDSFKRHFTAADDRCRLALFEDAGMHDLREIPWEKYVVYSTSESSNE